MIAFIIFLLFVGATIVQLVFWLFLFTKLAFYRPEKVTYKKGEIEEKPVSVIICARNEAENLKKNLPKILSQNYGFYEIIVVNDNSSDETEAVLLHFKSKTRILRSINLKSGSPPGKKTALTRGITAANHDVLLLTDADCCPESPNWIFQMQSTIAEEAEIGLGFSPYYKDKGLLNKFIRFETAYTAIQYLSFALAGSPYMGVGRNLIYKKSLFLLNDGFRKHKHIASGDDDLFVNDAATGNNTRIIISPGSFVYSNPKTTWAGYYHQKSRHFTTGNAYKLKHKILLGLLSASHTLHYLLGLILLFDPTLRYYVIEIYLVRILVVSTIYSRNFKLLNQELSIPWAPVLDAVYVLFYLIFAPVLLIGKKEKWK